MRAEFFSFSIQCIHLKTSQICAHTHTYVIRAPKKISLPLDFAYRKLPFPLQQNRNIEGRAWVLFRRGGLGLTRRGGRVSGAGQSSLRLSGLTPNHPVERKTRLLQYASRLQLHVAGGPLCWERPVWASWSRWKERKEPEKHKRMVRDQWAKTSGRDWSEEGNDRESALVVFLDMSETSGPINSFLSENLD